MIKKAEPDPATGYRPHPYTKNVKGKYNARPVVQIDTFNQLVSEVISKPGLNKRVKYALLRALGMPNDKAKEALKQVQPMKHTERIKPILRAMLSDLASDNDKKQQ